MSCVEGVDDGRSGLGHRIVFDVDPAYAWIAAEPSLLANGELTCAGDDLVDRFILTDPTIERLEDFLVAECL